MQFLCVHTHTQFNMSITTVAKFCVSLVGGGVHKSSVSCHENDMEEEK